MIAPVLSVVIPVYRSQGTLRPLAVQLVTALEALGRDYEIIFVEDGSPDRSWEVLRELEQTYPGRIVVIQLMRNYGQHNALMCGLRHARGDFIVTMDDDLQHPPAEIATLLAAIEREGADVVYGTPDVKKHTAWRNLGSTLVNVFFRTIFRCPIPVTSFRVIRRPVARSILRYSLNFTYIDGLLAWNTQRVAAVEVEHLPSSVGGSRYSIGKLVLLALNLFTNFSLLPLQIVSAVGMLAAVGGSVLGCFYLVQYFVTDNNVPGYASVIIAVLVLGGGQMLSLGIIGEYLGRLHMNVNRKPQYTVRHVLGRPKAISRGRRPGRGVSRMKRKGREVEKCEVDPL
jgi:undecaprenyl-phosphate 4-deoxy-4-formamido-L-arabinose transferase